MNAAPRTATQVWLKKSWKLVNNPFPTTGIARLEYVATAQSAQYVADA